MAKRDTRTYEERKARGDAERHRYQGKTVRLSDEAWDALEDRAAKDYPNDDPMKPGNVTQVIRDAVAKYLNDPSLAD